MSNRKEEHLAIALFNLGRRRWPEGGWFRLLDYQVPLKAQQADTRIGKIDLLGVTDQGRLVIIELKVDGASGGRSDSPSCPPGCTDTTGIARTAAYNQNRQSTASASPGTTC